MVSNWIMGEMLRELKNDEQGIENPPITPKQLTDLLKLIDKGAISGKMGKTVFEEMFHTGKPADVIVQEKGLAQISDSSAIEKLVEEILAANAEQVESYKNGKDKVFGYLVGQIMKASKGQANPAVVNQLLKEKLSQ
jgi:aspartyl-tRNA(Asn)/glutamyl-tRNA(Gln) amidotransferase subunit B